jgi:hypothetical protein
MGGGAGIRIPWGISRRRRVRAVAGISGGGWVLGSAVEVDLRGRVGAGAADLGRGMGEAGEGRRRGMGLGLGLDVALYTKET